MGANEKQQLSELKVEAEQFRKAVEDLHEVVTTLSEASPTESGLRLTGSVKAQDPVYQVA